VPLLNNNHKEMKQQYNRPAHQYKEVFTAELPSPCNLYLSCKGAIATNPSRVSTTSTVSRFATEHHSIKLLKQGCGTSSVNHHKSGGDDYSLSVERLPSASTRAQPSRRSHQSKSKGRTSKKTQKDGATPANDSAACVAHSYLQLGQSSQTETCNHPSSIEVFAMVRVTHWLDSQTGHSSNTVSSSNEAKPTAPGVSVDNINASVQGKQAKSEGGTDSGTEQHSTEMAGENKGSAVQPSDEKATIPNYYLLIKSRSTSIQSNETKSITATMETIPLTSRPTLVYATELCVATEKSMSTTVGIFVANADDDTLRLYLASDDTWLTHFAELTSVFDQSSVTSSGSERGDNSFNDRLEKPLTFLSSIMAMDACTTDSLDDMRCNRLAISCYDGTIRILTYQLKRQIKQSEKGDLAEDVSGATASTSTSNIRVHNLRCSTFLVDGPIVTLRFGTTSPIIRIDKSGNDEDVSTIPSSTLFLVVGSLCGVACLFYEVPLPPDDRTGNEPCFDGPLTIVDGLYDTSEGGYEDCVTTVCVCSDVSSRQIIAVGTQGGRMLLFRRLQLPEYSTKSSTQTEVDDLVSQINDAQTDISLLEAEKKHTEAEANALTIAVEGLDHKLKDIDFTGMDIEIKECVSSLVDRVEESADVIGEDQQQQPHDNNDCVDGLALEVCDEQGEGSAVDTEDGDGSVPDATNRHQEVSATTIPAQSSQRNNDEQALLPEPVKSDLSLLQQRIAGIESKIAEHMATINTNESRLAVIREAKVYNDWNCMLSNLRRLHRHEFLSEHRLPYPVYGIASVADERGSTELFVTTRRTCHVFGRG
jgi:hypothetical protein